MKINFTDYVIHQIILLFSSLFFVFTLFSILNDLSDGGLNYIKIPLLIFIFFCSIINLFIFRIFKEQKVKTSAYIQFVAISNIVYMIFGFILGRFFNLYCFPVFISISSLILFLYMNYERKPFECYIDFLKLCEDKAGADLASAVYHENTNALDFGQYSKSLKGVCVTFLGIFILIFSGLEIGGKTISVVTYIFFLLYLLNIAGIFILFTIYNNETFYAFLGLEKIFSLRYKIFKVGLIICLLAVFSGILLSSDKSLFDVTKLLSRIKPSETYVEKEFQDIPYEQTTIPMPSLDLTTNYSTVENPVIDLILKIIKYLFFTSLITGILIFLIKPFTEDSWKKFWKQKKLYILIHSLFQNLHIFFKSFFGKTIVPESYAKADSYNFFESINDFLKNSKKSKEKKAELDKLSKAFMKLIDWGNEHEYKYQKSLAPLEYTRLFNNPMAEECGNLFEKALYAKELLSEDEINHFFELIDEIIK